MKAHLSDKQMKVDSFMLRLPILLAIMPTYYYDLVSCYNSVSFKNQTRLFPSHRKLQSPNSILP